MSPHIVGPSDNTGWQVSRTCDSGACVGVGRRGEMVLVANTNSLEGPIAQFTADEWRQFLAGVKLGDFDRVVEGN